jgi:hypothetical protein
VLILTHYPSRRAVFLALWTVWSRQEVVNGAFGREISGVFKDVAVAIALLDEVEAGGELAVHD